MLKLPGHGRCEPVSIARDGDLHVTQTVDNVKGVHAMIAKSILQKPTS